MEIYYLLPMNCFRLFYLMFMDIYLSYSVENVCIIYHTKLKITIIKKSNKNIEAIDSWHK